MHCEKRVHAGAGPHPVLRRLVRLDAVAVLGILRESLTGWDALDTDLYEAAGRPPPTVANCSATQVRCEESQLGVAPLITLHYEHLRCNMGSSLIHEYLSNDH